VTGRSLILCCINVKNRKVCQKRYLIISSFLEDCSSGTEEFSSRKSISHAIRNFGEGAWGNSKGFTSNAGNHPSMLLNTPRQIKRSLEIMTLVCLWILTVKIIVCL
jgi:hypothetical protein